MSNIELINELKSIYREYLSTDTGKKDLKTAIELKKEWATRKADVQFNTKGIISKYIPKLLRNRMVCVNITPIGLNNMCHITSALFAKKNKNVKHILGYNITACPCGRLMTMELHSVNKIGDELYDFTKDFNEEKSKYFIPLHTEMRVNEYVRLFGREPITIDKTCKCNVEWGDFTEYVKDEDEIIELINYIEK